MLQILKNLCVEKKRIACFPLVVLMLFTALATVQAGEMKAPRVNGMIQVWDQHASDSASPKGLFLKRTELKLSGSIIPDAIGYEFLIDPASGPGIINLDMIIHYQVSSLLKISIGQMKIPLTREGLAPSSQLDFIDRAMITAREYGDRRDTGLLLSGQANIIKYSVGVFNGAGSNTSDNNDEKDFAARMVVQPMESLTLGASTYYGSNSHVASDVADVERFRIGGELVYVYNPFTLKTEYMQGQDDSIDSRGYYAAFTYVFNPKIEFAMRYDAWEYDLTAKDGESLITLGGNYRLQGNAAKIMVNYILHDNGVTDTQSNDLLVQFQVEF